MRITFSNVRFCAENRMKRACHLLVLMAVSLATFRCKSDLAIEAHTSAFRRAAEQVASILHRVISTHRLLLTTPQPTQRFIPSMPR
jgi:hypothetical protein